MTEARVPVMVEDRAEYPHIRKVGRYGFYALCALGLGALAYAAIKAMGLNADFARVAADIAGLAAFLALRDIEKNAAIRQMGGE